VIRDRTNARHLNRESFPEPIALAVVDASFISLDKLLPAIADFLPSGAHLLALIKPQFEVGREQATRSRGVVKDDAMRSEAVAQALGAVESAGFSRLGDCRCRVPGPRGNVEHFVLAVRR
jgi:23S rRNA (cytidine1920-2'-O)/16S rRNA (cytidine1409-2'-O)-methyltransferase